MALLLREIPLSLEQDESQLKIMVGRTLGVDVAAIKSLRVVRKAIDARQKPKVIRVYTVEFIVDDEKALLERHRDNKRLSVAMRSSAPSLTKMGHGRKVVVVGMGPAGLFAALRLARQGGAVTVIERGAPVEKRVRDVRQFWATGALNERSNVQFGEGGAGTFSDGKLTTRVNHPWTRFVLQTLVNFGAPSEILLHSKPHVGTDRLRLVLINFRRALLDLGVEIRFDSCLTGLLNRNEKVIGAVVNDTDEFDCDALVLAPGHSARDTYQMLHQTQVALEPKPFAIGARVEHPAELINRTQFGHSSHPLLPAADYALSYNDRERGRGVYSFCMCPGGEVVNASSERGGLVVNGMSSLERGDAWSNSALVVSVRETDFGGSDPLAGVRFQRLWEQRAFSLGGGAYRAPAQNLLTFLGRGHGPVRSSCRTGVVEADLTEALPPFVVDALRQALPHFNRRMRGFMTSEATLIGVETRTSAPLRILRDEHGESVSHPGLFPAGEGAGYAGGIMSAALDGLRIAGHIVERESQES